MFAKELTAALDTVTSATCGVPMRIVGPTGAPVRAADGTYVSVFLMGTDSDAYRRRANEAVLERMERAKSGRQVEMSDLEEAEEKALSLVVDCTVGWDGVYDTEGALVPFTRENVRSFYKAFPAAREQADRFIADRANFLPASSKG